MSIGFYSPPRYRPILLSFSSGEYPRNPKVYIMKRYSSTKWTTISQIYCGTKKWYSSHHSLYYLSHAIVSIQYNRPVSIEIRVLSTLEIDANRCRWDSIETQIVPSIRSMPVPSNSRESAHRNPSWFSIVSPRRSHVHSWYSSLPAEQHNDALYFGIASFVNTDASFIERQCM